MGISHLIKALLVVSFVSIHARAALPLTVSGVSAGGYFAQQFHVAHSSWVKGAGILAAGPYACARHGLIDAFYKCMEVSLGLPEMDDSLQEMRTQARLRGVDALSNLANSKVYLLSGTRDATVSPQVVSALYQMYRAVGVEPVFERSLQVGHAFPTRNFGNPCTVASKPPYISNCSRDIAGEMLKVLIGNLNPPVKARTSQLFHFSQAKLGEFARPGRISMAEYGMAYVPSNCRPLGTKECRVHLAFHGCRQTTDLIGDQFITKTGYNEWAQSNDLIVVYPQTIRSTVLGNPRGCWDWWGYNGILYYTKIAPQISVISKIARAFQRGNVKLLPGVLLPKQE